MIKFETIQLNDKTIYEKLLHNNTEHGCEYSFSNLFMWGTQRIAFLDNHVLLFSSFDSHCFYPFPVGCGNKKDVLEAIFKDAKERKLCCCLTGLNAEDKQTLEKLYPGKFYYRADRNNYDYVYDIHSLADLKGRKLHRKRNHLKHFQKNHPNCGVEPITDENLDKVKEFITSWYEMKLEEDSARDYHHEQAALEKALTFYKKLGMEGLLLIENNEIMGFTLGSQSTPDTFDVHYEKARGDIDGAYTTINSSFANYIRKKYPHIAYLNREEDMGIPGLRKAKQSYFPHHLIKKYRAFPLRYSFDINEAAIEQVPFLRSLWKEAFGDSDAFLDNFFSTAFDPKRCRVAVVNSVSTENNSFLCNENPINISITNNPDNTLPTSNIAAALYWFDCTISGQKCAYIYGVATAKAYRGNGACHMLLADTHAFLKENGYHSIILVPGSEKLVHLYESAEYEVCTSISEINCRVEDMDLSISGIICDAEEKKLSVYEISKEDYTALRPNFLPKNSVLQEGENINFLATQAKFYKGDGFLLAASIENENLFGVELLGDTSAASEILYALGCKDGTFRTPGKDVPFTMFYRLQEDAVEPEYFGFAFD